jgi:hypothetical protein
MTDRTDFPEINMTIIETIETMEPQETAYNNENELTTYDNENDLTAHNNKNDITAFKLETTPVSSFSPDSSFYSERIKDNLKKSDNINNISGCENEDLRNMLNVVKNKLENFVILKALLRQTETDLISSVDNLNEKCDAISNPDYCENENLANFTKLAKISNTLVSDVNELLAINDKKRDSSVYDGSAIDHSLLKNKKYNDLSRTLETNKESDSEVKVPEITKETLKPLCVQDRRCKNNFHGHRGRFLHTCENGKMCSNKDMEHRAQYVH